MDSYEILRMLLILPLVFTVQKLDDCPNFVEKNTINMGSYGLWQIYHDRNESFYWKKNLNVDNKEEIDDIFCDIICKYSLKIFSKK